MIKNTARIDTIYPHLTLQNKQSVSSLSFTLANLQFACQLTIEESAWCSLLVRYWCWRPVLAVPLLMLCLPLPAYSERTRTNACASA